MHTNISYLSNSLLCLSKLGNNTRNVLKYIWLTEYEFFFTDEKNPYPKKKKLRRRRRRRKIKKRKNKKVDEPTEKRVCPGDGEWMNFYLTL